MGEMIGFPLNKNIYYMALIENYKNSRGLLSDFINKRVIPKLFEDEKLDYLKGFSYSNDWSYYEDDSITLYFYQNADGKVEEININILEYI